MPTFCHQLLNEIMKALMISIIISKITIEMLLENILIKVDDALSLKLMSGAQLFY